MHEEHPAFCKLAMGSRGGKQWNLSAPEQEQSVMRAKWLEA